MVEVNKELSKQWKELSVKDRKPFEEQSEKHKDEVSKLPLIEKEVPLTKRKNKKTKDPNAPKRPKNSYLIFQGDMREKVKAELGKDAKIGEIGKEIGKRWEALDEKEKAKYQKKAEDLLKQYHKDMEKYKQETE